MLTSPCSTTTCSTLRFPGASPGALGRPERMRKHSRMVHRRHLAAHRLRGGVTALGPRPAKALEERMAAVLEEGEQVPDVMHFIDVLSRMLVHEADKLDVADGARRHSAGAADCTRKHYRDPAADELRQMIVDLRKCLTGMYGTRQANDLLGFRGRTPRGLAELQVFGRLLVMDLPKLKLPAPKVDIGVSPQTWAEKMKPLVERLETHSEELQSQTRTWDIAVGERNVQLGEFDDVYGPVARLIECVYLLGGEPWNARKLRLRFRRRLVNRRAAMAARSVPGVATAALAAWGILRAMGRRLARRIGHWLGSCCV